LATRLIKNILPWPGLQPAICLISFLLTITVPGYPQNYPLQEYTVLNGLPQTQTRTLFQDSRGFLWIITRNGISRFDGIEFKNFFRKDGLPANIVSQILEDSKGYIWAVSQFGLARYNGYNFEFFPYTEKRWTGTFIETREVKDTMFMLLRNHESGASTIFYFMDGKYNKYHKEFQILDTLIIGTSVSEESSGCFWFTDLNDNLWKWRADTLIRVPEVKITNIKEDRGKILLEGYGESYEISGGEIIPRRLISDPARAEIYRDPDEESDFINFYRDGMVTKIRDPYYSSTIIDDESNIWFGTEVNLYRLVSTAFSCFDESNGLPRNTWAIAEDKNGKIWFGTLTGDLLLFDGDKFIPMNEYKKLFGPEPVFYKGSIRRADGNIYFSLNVGVLVWDGTSFSRLSSIPDKTQVCVIFEDPVDRSALIGTDRGLFVLKNGKTVNFREFTHDGLGVIEGIESDDNGGYWLSGEKGIVHFDGRNSVPLTDSIMPAGYTFTMTKDNRGGLWITADEGLFFKGSSSTGLRYGLPEELNTSANSIIAIDSSRILVGRMTDVCIIDITKFYNNDPDYFKIYDNSFGFTGSDCLDHGIIKAKNGNFWIMSSGKVTILDPKKLVPNKVPPKINLTDIEFQTDSLTWESFRIPELFYNKHNNIRINHRQNDIRFRFTGISTTNPLKVMYQYRLIGREGVWSRKTYVREAVFQDLPPGNYEFQLKAFNADGIETQLPYVLKFSIVPAFWQTVTFRLVAALSAILIIVLLTWRVAKNYIKKKNEKEQLRNELSWLQMNSVIRQFDPHFTFNLIASAGSLIMRGKKETAYDYIVKLSGLLRAMLSDGTIMVRPLGSEIDFVKKYCELQKMRFKERLACKFFIDENINFYRLIPKMTIQTFVENSIKHGIENRMEGGEVTVRISEINDSLEIIVSDNGVGREAAGSMNTNGSGYGLKTINAIFEFMNRVNRAKASIEITDLIDVNNRAKGTDVKIIIPHDFNFEMSAQIKS